jgi:hypothetical protein
MKRIRLTIVAFAAAVAILVGHDSTHVQAASALGIARGAEFVLDVAMDGSTWRMNDGSNPFFPIFTGALARGNTFIVSGRIYREGTLAEGGTFGGGANNPAGPELGDAIGTWVCRGTFNLDIADIAAGAYPHVTSTQVFTFDSGDVIVTEGPEGGAPVLRSVIGGAERFRKARGDVVETPLGVNTSNLFNVRFNFDLD